MRCAEHLLAQCLPWRRLLFSLPSWSLRQTRGMLLPQVWQSPSPHTGESLSLAREGLLGSWCLRIKEKAFSRCAQGKLIRKTNIYGASARGQGSSSSHSARDSAVGLLEPGAPRRPAGSGAGGGSSAKASWLSGNKVNIAPDVCPGVEAISSSLPAHFIFQN